MIYTIPELSKITGISENTLRTRQKVRKLPFFMHKYRITFSYLNAERLIDQQIPQHVSEILVYQFHISNPTLSNDEIKELLVLPDDYIFDFDNLTFIIESK